VLTESVSGYRTVALSLSHRNVWSL
jgi:hypothetical protein